MERSKNETLLETPNPPHKKARNWKKDISPYERVLEEERWQIRMSHVTESHLVRAVYDNAMNSLIEGTGCMGQVTVEDEAVTMAIRCHGLTCTSEHLKKLTAQHSSWSPEDASTSTSSGSSTVEPPSTSTEDILSHAVAAAIRKKGLGAVDR